VDSTQNIGEYDDNTQAAIRKIMFDQKQKVTYTTLLNSLYGATIVLFIYSTLRLLGWYTNRTHHVSSNGTFCLSFYKYTVISAAGPAYFRRNSHGRASSQGGAGAWKPHIEYVGVDAVDKP